MFNRTATRATAIGLAAMVTLTMLAGMNALATQQHAAATLAQAGNGPVQQVVIVGHRQPGA